MRLTMIGLGKMGGNMTRRLLAQHHEVVAHDRDPSVVAALADEGAIPANTLEEAIAKTKTPNQPSIVWVMVPAGPATTSTLETLAGLLTAGDIVIDGGNSNFKESIAHAQMLAKHGINMIDCGTSGGVWGLKNGYCLMTGGSVAANATCKPIFDALAQAGGYLHAGESGAGHFTKMIHNGIEYGIMQSLAEGFEIMEKSPFKLDLHAVAELWQHGSVVRGWLLELLTDALGNEKDLGSIKGFVPDSGEGRWTVQTAMEYDVPAPVITMSLLQRFVSRQDESFAAKVVAALRNQFGGHAIKKANE